MVADPDWGWTRDSIIDLLKTGFEGGAERLSCERRALIWSALTPLTDDPFPSLEDERGERFDPSFLSINSTRGRALYAALEYAQWVRSCADAQRKTTKEPPQTLNAMPEVREVLDRHLDINLEPTLTIRSLYGHALSCLAGLDWEWFRANVSRILPLGEPDSPYFNAAWESFVVFNQPNNTLLGELIPAYHKAVAEMRKGQRRMRSPASPDECPPDELRGHAMWFIGRSVSGWDEAAPPAVFERLQRLMERRLRSAEEGASSDVVARELANFGWWFTSGKFGDRWSIETLLRILRITKKTEAEMDVVKRLAELCSGYPVECVACFGLMIEGDRDHWLLVGVEDDARRMIKIALESNRPDAVMSARRLVEHLIARGQYGFRSLLG